MLHSDKRELRRHMLAMRMKMSEAERAGRSARLLANVEAALTARFGVPGASGAAELRDCKAAAELSARSGLAGTGGPAEPSGYQVAAAQTAGAAPPAGRSSVAEPPGAEQQTSASGNGFEPSQGGASRAGQAGQPERPALGLYLPFRGEADITGIIRWCREAGFEAAVPITEAAGGMAFYRYAPERGVRAGRFGVPEPAVEADEPAVEPERLIALLVPGVAFTKGGARLGYGGGYYDRFIARWRNPGDAPTGFTASCRTSDDAPSGFTASCRTTDDAPTGFIASCRTRPWLIGVAYDFQVVPEWPAEPHDQAMDIVITD